MKSTTTAQVGTPKPDAPTFIDQPWSDKDCEKAFAAGYLPAHPPTDYNGSLADWAVAMAEVGGPDQWEELTMLWVRADVWEKVLDECEGTA